MSFSLTKFYSFFLALIVVTRCISEFISLTGAIRTILVLVLLSIGFIKKFRTRDYVDIFWLLMPSVIILNHAAGYQTYYILIFLIAISARYVFFERITDIRIIQNVILTFSIITSLVSWVSVFSPNIYNSLVLPMINESGRLDAHHYTSIGSLCGLTDHYSRNAYFVCAGLMIVFSRVWTNEKKLGYYAIIAFEFMTLMAIGKRGHLLFLLLSLLPTYLLIQKTISKKIIKSIKLICCILLGMFVLYSFVPSARHTFDRIEEQNDSEDFSNGRITNYALAYALFLENPIKGIGYGGFSAATKDVYAGVHNDYLQFLCETGIIGFFIFIGWGIFSLICTIKTFHLLRRHPFLQPNEYGILIWSTFFQIFVMLYSFTGLPHFDFEINTIYIVSCVVPFALKNKIEKRTRFLSE